MSDFSLETVSSWLDASSLSYQEYDDHLLLSLLPEVTMIITLDEQNEWLSLCLPEAWNAQGEHEHSFLQACIRLQMRNRLVRYAYDLDDGEVRPGIDIPINGAVTHDQFVRCMQALARVWMTYNPVLEHVLKSGDFDLTKAAEVD